MVIGPAKKDANKSATLPGLEEGTLPFGRDSVARSLNVDAVSLLEWSKGDKAAVQQHIEGLHDLVGVSYRPLFRAKCAQ